MHPRRRNSVAKKQDSSDSRRHHEERKASTERNSPVSSKAPVPDRAEHNAYFPSEYSLARYVPARTDFDGAVHEPITSGPRRILMIATDERYLPLKNGRFFSTGNHPVEMLVPMMHLAAAGYDFDIATLSGNMVKLELWGLPPEDTAVIAAHNRYLPQLDAPMRLADVVESNLGPDSPYAAVFIPGGHGATVRIPHSSAVKDVLDWALANEIFIVSLCHGPAALLAATDAAGENSFKGYRVCVFPDSLDHGRNREIGYLPGEMKWLVAEELKASGITVINDDMTGQVHQDRRLLTGDSPLASNALGRMAVKALRDAHPC